MSFTLDGMGRSQQVCGLPRWCGDISRRRYLIGQSRALTVNRRAGEILHHFHVWTMPVCGLYFIYRCTVGSSIHRLELRLDRAHTTKRDAITPAGQAALQGQKVLLIQLTLTISCSSKRYHGSQCIDKKSDSPETNTDDKRHV